MARKNNAGRVLACVVGTLLVTFGYVLAKGIYRGAHSGGFSMPGLNNIFYFIASILVIFGSLGIFYAILPGRKRA